MITYEYLTWDRTNLPTEVKCSAMLWLHVFKVSHVGGGSGLNVKIYERSGSVCSRTDNKIHNACIAVGATLTIPAAKFWRSDAVDHTVQVVSWTENGAAVLKICADLPEPEPIPEEPEPGPEPEPGTPTPGTPGPSPAPEDVPVGPEPEEPPSEVLIVSEGGYFEFNNDIWQVLNIVCSNTNFVTLADTAAQTEAKPQIGDLVTFTADIDWNGGTVDQILWFYAKAYNKCKKYPIWVRFAEGTSPTVEHTFQDDEDNEITFLMVVARNTDGSRTVVGLDYDLIFNLWPLPEGFRSSWLVAAFMAFALPGFAEKTEYFGDLVFDGTPETTEGGFSLSMTAAAFVTWIAEEAAVVAEDMCDIIFGTAEAEETGSFSLLWSAAEFVAWLYKSIAAMVEDILDIVFADD